MNKILIALLFTLNVGGLFAADYVDDINKSVEMRSDEHRVVYEMNVGSFTTEGTFSAAQARLYELKTLGVDVVWLMPIYPRGGGINSPYAATNFQQTNPSYGSIAVLKTFVARAHELGMEVWLDWVPNHTATNADWVTTHPEYYLTSGGQMVHPNNYGDVWQLELLIGHNIEIVLDTHILLLLLDIIAHMELIVAMILEIRNVGMNKKILTEKLVFSFIIK